MVTASFKGWFCVYRFKNDCVPSAAIALCVNRPASVVPLPAICLTSLFGRTLGGYSDRTELLSPPSARALRPPGPCFNWFSVLHRLQNLLFLMGERPRRGPGVSPKRQQPGPESIEVSSQLGAVILSDYGPSEHTSQNILLSWSKLNLTFLCHNIVNFLSQTSCNFYCTAPPIFHLDSASLPWERNPLLLLPAPELRLVLM